ncbi:MAG: prepilin-type N-terminal cleavage/methylation domain-containing protein [Deltaproteobacteria bacterium]|nr:MAG: prepilin-type N-terminal cleavage/methylation domain-containing protein [Deltaproteobacteria bacterium]
MRHPDIRGRLPGERGMTLIEIMLALVIFTTLIVLTWGSITSSFRLRAASLDRFEQYRLVQNAMDRMSRELSMAFVTNIGDPPTNDRREVTYRTLFEGERDSVTFTSFAHVRTRAGQVATDQAAITYRIERRRGRDGRLVPHLVRRSETPIDATPERGGTRFALLAEVQSVTFEYWDGDRTMAGSGWTRSWDASQHEGRLPERVRITVEMPHPHLRNQTMTFRSQAFIHLREPVVIIPASVMESLQRAASDEEALEQLDEGGTRRQVPPVQRGQFMPPRDGRLR